MVWAKVKEQTGKNPNEIQSAAEDNAYSDWKAKNDSPDLADNLAGARQKFKMAGLKQEDASGAAAPGQAKAVEPSGKGKEGGV